MLTINQCYNGDHFFPFLMIALHLGLILFHNQQHQDFISILQSMQDDQVRLLGEYGIYQKVHLFTFVHHYINFVCK